MAKCKLCNNLVISDNVSTTADTLLIDIPNATYLNCHKYCIVIAQPIPTGATINQPVAISIGGVTSTIYPVVNEHCQQVTACAIRTRTRYSMVVQTNANGGVFKVLGGLSCYPATNLPSLPVATNATRTIKTTIKKEIISNE